MKNNNIIRIAIITLSMDVGGLEKLIINLSASLNQDLYDITIICLDHGGELLEVVNKLGLKNIVLNRGPGFDWRLIFKLSNFLIKNKFDIVHTHNQGAHFYGCISAKFARIPVIITTEHSRHNSELYYRRQIEKRVLFQFTDKWIVVSNELAELAISKDKLHPKKVVVINNGVDVQSFTKPNNINKANLKVQNCLDCNCLLVAIIARLHPIKNHLLLIEAINEIKFKLPMLHLAIVGDGECKNLLVNKVKKYDLSDRIHFFGTRHDIPEILWMSDLYVLCSFREGLPFSLIEAAAAMVPIVITKSANRAGFIIDRVNGRVSNDDHYSLSGIILEYFNENNQNNNFVYNAYASVVENYSIAAMVNKYELLYQSLLCKKV